MTQTYILTTANHFEGIERAVNDWFKTPLRLVTTSPDEWRVCRSDLKPFGAVSSYFVVRQGTRYRLESRQPPQQPIIHKGVA